MKKATRQQTKDHNSRLVLKTIYEQSELSRADIARATHLTRPTVSTIVADLIENDFVVESGQGPSAGGKRPTLLNVNHDGHLLLCLDLGSQAFRGALVNLRGEICHELDLPPTHQDSHLALQLVYGLTKQLLSVAAAPVLGIGVGTPGLVDTGEGVVLKAVNLGWNQLPLATLLEEQFGKPVYVANDSQMAALGEYTFGEKRDSNNLIVIKIGQGIGAGIVINGRLYYGDGRGAGEIGHVVVVEVAEVAEKGNRCVCGNVGCLETVSSTQAILQRARHIAATRPGSLLSQGEVTWETLVAAVKAGDPAACDLVTCAGRYLGIAVGNLIGSFNIQHIALAGRVSQFGDLFLDAVRAETRRRVLPEMADATEISYASLGREIVILGSSALVLQQELGII
jgi:glucokinase-like ROK family protein